MTGMMSVGKVSAGFHTRLTANYALTVKGKGRVAQRGAIGNERRHTLDDQIGPKDTHGGDTNASLGSSVRSTEAGEDDG